MKIIKNTILFIVGLFFTLLALIGVGAIAEGHYLIIDRGLELFLGNSLFIVICYVAFNFASLAVIKFTLVNGCFAALSWDEIKNPGMMRSLLYFTKHSVLFHNKKSFADTINMIPICNQSLLLEDKIRFCLNPISLIMALLVFAEEMVVYFINAIPLNADTQKTSNEYEYPYNVSPVIYRGIKGIVVIACDVIIIPLKIIEPIGNIIYKILYLLVVTLPDYFAARVNEYYNHAEHESGACQSLSGHFFKRYSTHDIHKKLQEDSIE